jgi:REP element-mobilizing transposase RayT
VERRGGASPTDAEPVELSSIPNFAPAGRREFPMPGTYSQLMLHAVFSTKHRAPWITDEISKELYSYVGGVIRGEKGTLLDIGGVEDHIHLYFRWRTDGAISALMRAVKANSSK